MIVIIVRKIVDPKIAGDHHVKIVRNEIAKAEIGPQKQNQRNCRKCTKENGGAGEASRLIIDMKIFMTSRNMNQRRAVDYRMNTDQRSNRDRPGESPTNRD